MTSRLKTTLSFYRNFNAVLILSNDVFLIIRLGNLRRFFYPKYDDFQVILDDILDGFPLFRLFLDDFLKVTKYNFLRIQAVRKNKQGIDMAYFVMNASKIAFKRIKMFFLSKDLPKFACRKISATIPIFFYQGMETPESRQIESQDCLKCANFIV
jgi:hypothetical protein